MDKLKVASAQFPLIDNDIKGNMQRAEKIVREVMNEKEIDLLLFSELCLEGVDIPSFEEILTPAVIEEIEEFWKSMARLSGINILAGHVGKRNGVWENLATCYSPDGTILAEYSKTHLYNEERKFFKAGDKHVLFELKGFKIGILICADLGFPEFSRVLAKNGADVFAVPSCWGFPHHNLWVMCNQMRAVENGCFLISANRCSVEKSGRVTVGNSMAVNPSGDIIGSLGFASEGYFVSVFDKREKENPHAAQMWLGWLRPELYFDLKD